MEEKTLIPASEARRIVENGENEKSLKIWNEVVKEINKAIIIGKCECSVDGCSLPASVIKKLQALGYKAENGSQYNQSYYIIRW